MKSETPVKEAAEKTEVVAPKREGQPYPFRLLQRDMNRLFEDFAHGIEMWRPRLPEPWFGDFQIKIDLKDNENEIVLTAEIPGVDEKDIELSISKETLTIKGEKKEEKEEKEKGYYHAERSYGCFQRVMPLPCEVDKDKVEATFTKGVLKVVLPKSKESMKDTKKVEIKPA